MKKVKVEFDVYQYNELDKEIQEKLLEREKQAHHGDYLNHVLFDDMNTNAHKLLSKHFKGATLNELSYSLSYRQGDGVTVEFELSATDLNNKYKFITDGYLNDEDLLDEDMNDMIIYVKHDGTSYSHSYSFNIASDIYIPDTTFDLFKNDIINLNDELEKIGYDLINPDNHDLHDVAMECLEEMEYLKDGKIFNSYEFNIIKENEENIR